MDFIDQYLDGLCRTCLIEVEASSFGNNSRPQWQSILDRIPECDTLRIAELLSTAVPQIQIQPSDELPKKICHECLHQLLSAYRFQQMCVQSEEQMRELVSRKHTEFEMSIMEAFKEHELETSDTYSKALETAHSSSSHQNLEHSAIQKPLPESTERMEEDDAVQSSFLEKMNKVPEAYNKEECGFNEFIKNEPIEEDDTMHSTNSIECKQEEISLSTDEIIEPKEEQSRPADQFETIDQFTNFEFIKNEPLDDEPSVEYSDSDIIHSTISVTKEEVLAIELEEQQLNMKCKLCNKSFRKLEYLERHQELHKTKCDKFHKDVKLSRRSHKGKSPQGLSSNRIRRGESRPYECPYCPLRFSSSSMYHHKRIHEGVKREPCDICGKKIRKNHLKTHKLIHSKEKLHKCDICEKRFIGTVGLRSHSRTHTGEKPLKCKYCERAFSRHYSLYLHLRTHLGDNVFRCELCPLAFPLAAERRLHLVSHKNEDPETRERNIKALEEVEAKLRLQISKESIQQPSTKESEQQLETQVKDVLANHRNTHVEDKAYGCTNGPLRFNSNANKWSHEKMDEEAKGATVLSHKNEDPETRERNIKAPREDEAELKQRISKEKIQQASTEELQQLKDHIRHNDNKPYECPYCPLRFRAKTTVRQHKEIHEGVKREPCDICGKKIRKRDLRKHKQLVHSKEMLHKCDFCEKRFPTANSLRQHTNKHTGETPFKCKYCESAYARRPALNRHLRVHLGDNIYRCEFCPLTFPSVLQRSLHLISHKHEDAETRERNIKALQEDEAKLRLHISEEKTRKCLTEKSLHISTEKTQHPSTEQSE